MHRSVWHTFWIPSPRRYVCWVKNDVNQFGKYRRICIVYWSSFQYRCHFIKRGIIYHLLETSLCQSVCIDPYLVLCTLSIICLPLAYINPYLIPRSISRSGVMIYLSIQRAYECVGYSRRYIVGLICYNTYHYLLSVSSYLIFGKYRRICRA